MICCAIGAAAVATGAVGWRRFRRFHSWRPSKQLALAAGLMAMITMTIAGLAVEHLRHHTAYANGNEASLLTGLGTLPLCRGGAPADRPTDIASIEE
jgi:hypothetical protein